MAKRARWKSVLIFLAWTVVMLVGVAAAIVFWPLPDWVWVGVACVVILHVYNTAQSDRDAIEFARYQELIRRLDLIGHRLHDLEQDRQFKELRAEAERAFFTKRL